MTSSTAPCVVDHGGGRHTGASGWTPARLCSWTTWTHCASPACRSRPLGLTPGDLHWWEVTAREARRLLRAHHPEACAELTAGPRTLVPLGHTGSFSGSSAEAFGSMALSRPRSRPVPRP
ncbi:hypothetical protein [Streptomyces sp. NPDC050164]|uniref:hypothetical protein n=1 Tax=Streptomyces sp. NPDC050164 TaxID=3365605 RepID=UPI00379E8CCF